MRLFFLIVLLVSSCSAPPANIAQMPMRSPTLTDFTNASEAPLWRQVNDNVMGGISQGDFRLSREGTGLFEGTLSLENNGGFSSVRRATSDFDFGEASAIQLRVKGDGRRYQLRLQTSEAPDLSYRAEFDTAGEWQTLSLSFQAFEPVFRGRIVPTAPDLNPNSIQQLGFLIADKKSGDFRLEVDWIRVE